MPKILSPCVLSPRAAPPPVPEQANRRVTPAEPLSDAALCFAFGQCTFTTLIQKGGNIIH